MKLIIELLFKGLLQWLFDMIINITEYLANSLLEILNMDLTYIEKQLPITSDIVNIIIAVGWALMIGNLVFQAVKSMATGLGFEGEDPRMLFTRTFVMTFFLVVSRQICDIGLNITKTVIDLLQVPTIVQVPKLSEKTFSVPGDASWLLVIIIGIVLVVQLIKLFFEIGERYVITAILTLLSPLAFAMGGSKNTSDIFKGWVRMFASMCLMMIMSVIFLKLVLSAMSVVPTGVAAVPWCIFIVALAKTGRKIDNILARIGLNPASTGDPLGHSRIPGMLSYMVMKNLSNTVSKTTAANKSSEGNKSDVSRPVSGSSSSPSAERTPSRPPIGSSSTSKDTETSSTGLPASVTVGTSIEKSPKTETSPIPSTASGIVTSRDIPDSLLKTSDSAALSRPEYGSTSAGGKSDERSSKSEPSISSRPSIGTTPYSTDSKKSERPVAKTPTAHTPKAADSKTSPVSKPSIDSLKPSSSSISGTGFTTSKDKGVMTGSSVSDKKSADSDKEAMGRLGSSSIMPTPTADIKSDASARKLSSNPSSHGSSKTSVSRSSTASSTNRAGDVKQQGGNVHQNQTNNTNINLKKNDLPHKKHHPEDNKLVANTSRLDAKPSVINNTSARLESTKPSFGELGKPTAHSGDYRLDSSKTKATTEQYGGNSVKTEVNTTSTRTNFGSSKANSTNISNTTALGSKTSGNVSSTNSLGVTNNTLSTSGVSLHRPSSSLHTSEKNKGNVNSVSAISVENKAGKTVNTSSTTPSNVSKEATRPIMRSRHGEIRSSTKPTNINTKLQSRSSFESLSGKQSFNHSGKRNLSPKSQFRKNRPPVYKRNNRDKEE